MSLQTRIMALVCTFNEQDLSNTSWSFAKASQYDPVLFSALAKAAKGSKFVLCNPQHIANIAWGFAKVRHKDELLFMVLSMLAERRQLAPEFPASHLVNTVWAFAKMSYDRAELLKSLAKVAVLRIGEFNPEDLSHCA
eukprot:gnl/MRDRNA2_/MRDRNA2_195191_c0_seq1.p1 gnl/MRDRNA2_/MRDRNA2_195191_c0~~gnl/MRDRNA2_/MRDRNA2_195191_c0_seq1.p1  ORF type:complete len:138 (+),score=21.41 gnl/MRDRNA2_/MRDRNA2_195191_c0_seq1:605-1018(+)